MSELTDAEIAEIEKRHIKRDACADDACEWHCLIAALRASREREQRYETALKRLLAAVDNDNHEHDDALTSCRTCIEGEDATVAARAVLSGGD